MTGCDKIQIEHLDNGLVKIKFIRNIPEHVKAVYEKLEVEPKFSCEVPLEIELTKEEYYNTFIKPVSVF